MQKSYHVLIVTLNLVAAILSVAQTAEPIDIGSRRKLFVDDYLIGMLEDARRQLHHPTPREIAIVHDAPGKGTGSGYHSVIRDGGLYRMYYRGSELGVRDGKRQ